MISVLHPLLSFNLRLGLRTYSFLSFFPCFAPTFNLGLGLRTHCYRNLTLGAGFRVTLLIINQNLFETIVLHKDTLLPDLFWAPLFGLLVLCMCYVCVLCVRVFVRVRACVGACVRLCVLCVCVCCELRVSDCVCCFLLLLCRWRCCGSPIAPDLMEKSLGSALLRCTYESVSAWSSGWHSLGTLPAQPSVCLSICLLSLTVSVCLSVCLTV